MGKQKIEEKINQNLSEENLKNVLIELRKDEKYWDAIVQILNQRAWSILDLMRNCSKDEIDNLQGYYEGNLSIISICNELVKPKLKGEDAVDSSTSYAE